MLSRAELFEETIVEAARKEGVDPLVLWAIAYNETRFRPWLTSPKNAQGLMQFMPATASRFGLANPYEPRASIYAAARYVKYLGKLFEGRLESVLAAYNAGEGTVLSYLNGRTIRAQGGTINSWGRRTVNGVPPFRETINYVSQGVKVYRWLEAQGRLRKNNSLDEIAQTRPQTAERPNDPAAATTAVFYDPQTGNRFLVDRRQRLRSIEQAGPIVISPELRGLTTHKARSTFAGIGKP